VESLERMEKYVRKPSQVPMDLMESLAQQENRVKMENYKDTIASLWVSALFADLALRICYKSGMDDKNQLGFKSSSKLQAEESLESLIYTTLRESFRVSNFAFEDQSASHAAHYDEARDGGTHIALTIQSPDFEGKKRIEQHRMVYDALDAVIKERAIHALVLQLSF
jgi:BolA protein